MFVCVSMYVGVVRHCLDSTSAHLIGCLVGCRAEFVAHSRARAAEGEHYEARLQEAFDNIRRIADEARLREANHSAELARKAEEIQLVRRSAEEQHAAQQADISQLHELVTMLRNEKANQARTFDEERTAYDRKVSELTHRNTLGSASAEKLEAELKAENASLRAAVANVQQEVGAKDERHLAMLTALQGALRQLQANADASKADFATLVAATRSLHAHIGDALGGQQAPMQQWYEEVQRGFLYLMDIAENAKKASGEANDRLRGCEVALEEARSRGLMLEEAISRAEHDLAARNNRLSELGALLEARELGAHEASQASAAVIEDLQAELGRVKASLDKSNRAQVALQGESAKLASELADFQARSAARVAALDEQNASLSGSVRTLTVQVEGVAEEKAKLSAEIDSQAQTIEALRRQLRAVQSAAEQNNDTAKATLVAYAAQVSSLSEGMKKMDGQLKQTQSLLAVVQEQRRTLQENNVALRAELDERYKTSLMAASSSSLPSHPLPQPTPGPIQVAAAASMPMSQYDSHRSTAPFSSQYASGGGSGANAVASQAATPRSLSPVAVARPAAASAPYTQASTSNGTGTVEARYAPTGEASGSPLRAEDLSTAPAPAASTSTSSATASSEPESSNRAPAHVTDSGIPIVHSALAEVHASLERIKSRGNVSLAPAPPGPSPPPPVPTSSPPSPDKATVSTAGVNGGSMPMPPPPPPPGPPAGPKPPV